MIKTFEKFSHLHEYVLGVDLDGVLSNFTKSYNIIYKRYFPNNKIVPWQNIDNWDWHFKLDFDGKKPFDWFLEHKAEMWTVATPYDGAIETMDRIYEYTQDNGILLRIVTSQLTREAEEASVKWLNKHHIKYDDIAFTYRSKEKWDNADVLVDDGPPILACKPDNKISIKIIQKYNDGVDGDYNISSIKLLSPELVNEAFRKLENVSERVKWYNKGKFEDDKIFDVEEEENEDEVWAIFIIKHNKYYLTSINNNDTFGQWEIIKYSDPKTLKFTLERAKELVNKNELYAIGCNTYGIVNNKGIQLGKNLFNIPGMSNKLWKRI
jgi:hypothetical protein